MEKEKQIILAVQYIDKFLQISELSGAECDKDLYGEPDRFRGGCALVFPLKKNSKKWAFRVWHKNFDGEKDRFLKISKYLRNQKLPYFADFIYDENGLLVNGKPVDTTRMEWLEGYLLKDYIEKNLRNKEKLQKLADNFMSMCKILREHKISHGDLQHGNISIDNQGNIKLIDYDSVCVPEIENKKDLVTGVKGYQHPSRFNPANTVSLKADYFSELIIYLSLYALAESPQLWDKFRVKGSDVLLFKNEDFTNVQQSEIYKDLLNIGSSMINNLLQILVDYLNKSSYLDLEPFYSYLTPPIINYFDADNKQPILSGHFLKILWQVERARTILLNGQNVSGTTEKEVRPTKNENYTLKASNNLGVIEQTISVKVLPAPTINFQATRTKIEQLQTTKLFWTVSNAAKIELFDGTKTTDVTNSSELPVQLNQHTTYKLIVTALDNKTIFNSKEIRIEVCYKPEIHFFEIRPQTIVNTRFAKLQWQVANAKEIEIDNGIGKVANQGNINVNPTTNTKYTLTAKGELSDATPKSVELEVLPAPAIKFEATRIKIEHPQTIKLFWTISNAAKIELFDGTRTTDVTSSSELPVQPNQHTTYKLIVTALDNKTIFNSKEIRIEVFYKPEIFFEAINPRPFDSLKRTMAILDYEKATLRWQVKNAKSIEIDNGVGEITNNNGEIQVKPATSTTYTMTAKGELNDSKEYVIVRIFPTPIIKSILVPMPDFENHLNFNLNLEPPKIDTKLLKLNLELPKFDLNLPVLNLTTPKFIEPSDDLFNSFKNNNKKHRKSIFNFLQIHKNIIDYVGKRIRI